MKEPFLSAIPILQRLEAAGYEAYFVGGSVRDFILGRKISDVDIATSATPLEVKQVFKKTVDVGIEHGTVLVLYQNQSYEITTFRTEAEYVDFRRPKEVTFIRNLREDLERRDFTMNAIAMDRHGSLIDPFNGKKAIEGKLIQTVGSPAERFQEDALRMMRAVRFVSQLSFRIEEETEKALTTFGPLLGKIAVERKRVEFEKLLLGKNRPKALEIMLSNGLQVYLPGMKDREVPLKRLSSYQTADLSKVEMWSMLIFCFDLEGKQIEFFLREWRLPVKEIREIQTIVYFLKVRFKQEWSLWNLYVAGDLAIASVERLFASLSKVQTKENEWLDVYQSLPIHHSSEVDVTGSDLMKWYQKSGGPWLKEMLLTVEKAILEGNVVNEKQRIREWLKTCNQKSETNC